MTTPGVRRDGAAGGGTWRLRPGVHVVRRDEGQVQVGLDRRRAVVLPDVPAVRVVLTALTGPVGGDRGEETAWVRHRLARAGLLVDSGCLARDREAHGTRVATAAYARHGVSATARLAARRDASVLLEECGGAGAVPGVTGLVDDLGAHGLRLRAGPPLRHDDGAAVGSAGASLVLVLSATTLPRAVVDPLVRAGLPHLVVSGEDTGVRIGPFVVPGTTACLRCVDAHEAVDDPRWPLVREQVAADDRHPPPSTLDWRAATALAAVDVLRWVDGDRPLTWSATMRLGPDPELTPRPWTRHPHCGCAWDELTTTDPAV